MPQTGVLDLVPRYSGRMAGRPGIFVFWELDSTWMSHILGWEVHRRYLGQSKRQLLRKDKATDDWRNVPGFVSRIINDEWGPANLTQSFGNWTIRGSGQVFDVPVANKILRSFDLCLKSPGGRVNRRVYFQLHRVAGHGTPGGELIYKSTPITVSTVWGWQRVRPNIKLTQTGRYRISVLAESQEHPDYDLQVRSHANAGAPGWSCWLTENPTRWHPNDSRYDLLYRVNGGIFAYLDVAAPGTDLEYWVYPYNKYGQLSNYMYGEITGYRLNGYWLVPIRRYIGGKLMPTTDHLTTHMFTEGSSPPEFEVPGHQTIYRPIGVRRPVIKSNPPPGYEFTLTGHIRDFAKVSADSYKKRFEQIYGYSNEIKCFFVGSGMSFPIEVSELKLTPIKIGWYEISLKCFQSGMYSIPEMTAY